MTKKIYLEVAEVAIKRETAKMAWPGHMHPILKAGTKGDVETFFADKVNLACLKNIKNQTGLDGWHLATVNCLASLLQKHIKQRRESPPYSAQTVAAKLVDVFLHQLIKYRPFAHLYPYLHLPLDSKVWPKIIDDIKGLPERHCQLKDILRKNPYALTYDEYIKIQKILWKVLDSRLTDDVRQYGRSRILLNSTLWAGEKKAVNDAGGDAGGRV